MEQRDNEPAKEPLTPLEAQVIERIRNGEPHRLPPARVEKVFTNLTRKGYGKVLEEL